MNATHCTHPSQEFLSAFNSGRLGPLESAEIERHLAECDACCGLLKTLPNDTLISLLREAQTDTKTDPSRIFPGGVPHKHGSSDVGSPTLAQTPETQHSEEQGCSLSASEIPPELQNHPRYRIVSLLGRGGMGSVYEAEHRLMNRHVALKVIEKKLVQTPGLVERFQRETQTAARLSHPNIVAAHDAECAADLHFLVMELVRGRDLAQIVGERGGLTVREACDYVRQAALGLQHAFERGMVHRDIKPQNLMLTAEGQIKILDFGLAQFASEVAEESGLTQVGAMMGTPDYMAPEQARDAHSADIRADIYGLGCTLYCLLSGHAPFPEGSVLEKILAHVEREPAPLQELRGNVPPELAAVVKKMMSKLPADRFQTPAEVAEALAPFARAADLIKTAEDAPFAAKTSAVPPRWRIRSRVRVALAAFAILAALGVIVVMTDKGRVEIQSEVDDVEIVIKQSGKQIDFLDAKTGSLIKWLPSGKYDIELKGDRNDLEINRDGFTLSRWGTEIIKVTRKTDATDLMTAWTSGKLKISPFKKFEPSEKTIASDGVTAEDGGWKIDAREPRTARLFEVAQPALEDCVVLYRAKMKTENVKGRAFLEMWMSLARGRILLQRL